MSRSQRIERCVASRRGVAAIEFALVAPFIVLMMLAGTDLTIFMRTKMRIDETATETALAVTQYQDLYNGDFTALFNAAQTVAGATKVTGLFGTTIITGIATDGNDRQTISVAEAQPGGHGQQSVWRDRKRSNPAEQLSHAEKQHSDHRRGVHRCITMGPQRQPDGRSRHNVAPVVCTVSTPSRLLVDGHCRKSAMTTYRLLKRGSVAIMTGLLAIPLVAMTGAAIDLARIWLVKARLQMSLDAAVLAVARDLATGGTSADGFNLFWSNFGRISTANRIGYMGTAATDPVVHNPAPGGVTGSVQLTSSAS